MPRVRFGIYVAWLAFAVATGGKEGYPSKSASQCLEDAMKGRRFAKKVNTTMHLDFGDPALEMLNIISAHDAMTIRSLEYCVRTIVPEMFVDRSTVPSRNYTHGGSNLTFLTGVFQQVLPDIHKKVLASTVKPMQDESVHFWPVSIHDLGIRSVYVESFANIKPTLTKEERRAVRYAKYQKEQENTMVLGGPAKPFVEEEEEPEEEEEYAFDEQADENVRPYMRHSTATLYTMVLPLTDRSHFLGGEFYLASEKPGSGGYGAGDGGVGERNGEAEADEAEPEGYEEEDEAPGLVHDEPLHAHPKKKKKRATFPKYNARTAKIARYAPERGSVFLQRADYAHGMGTLHRGKRIALVIELWPFADSPAGTRRPLKSEALPLPPRHIEL